VRAEAAVIGAVGVAALLASIAMVVRWGEREVADAEADRTLGDQTRWWLRLVAVTVVTGIVSGVLVAGIGGRLAMRILAATAGTEAQGLLTEADEHVGFITFGGTVGFVTFVGLLGGMIIAALHLAVRPLLPAGRLGGALFGAGLLVVFASRVDPLRSENPDFDIVGPDLLSVAVFSSLALVQGMTTAAVFARFSAAVPLLDVRRLRTVLPYASLLLLVPASPLLLAFVVAGAVVISVRLVPTLRRAVGAPRALAAGRVALALVVLVAAPGFVSAVVDILGG
jgi:hypothetical protein